MTRPRMPIGYRQVPIGSELDGDGRCLLSELLPRECGLPCHRNSEDIPILHEAFEEGR
jgi:hypothetical protein